MTNTNNALHIGTVLLAIALLAIFDIIPEQVAQFAPLAIVPWLMRDRPPCRLFGRTGAV